MDSSSSDPFADDPDGADTPSGSRGESRSSRRPGGHRRRRHRRSRRETDQRPAEPESSGEYGAIIPFKTDPNRDGASEESSSGEPRRRRRRRRKQEREFRPYTRPKSRHHESKIDNALKAWSFSIRANIGWLKRRLRHGFRSQRRRRRRSAADLIKPRRRTNFRIIAFTVVAVGLAAVLVPQWREWQLRKATATMLDRALKLEQQHEFRDAAAAANEFVKLRPNSVEGTAALARCYGKIAENQDMQEQAAEFYRRALVLDPENVDLRREFAVLLFDGALPDRFALAETQADKIIDLTPEDPIARRILALSLYAQAHGTNPIPITRAIDALKMAVRYNPTDVQLAGRLADVYRQEMVELYSGEREMMADEVMDQLVLAAPQSPDALLARYNYRLRYQIAGADTDLDQALNLSPDNVRVLVAAGERGLLRRRWPDARGPFTRLLSIASSDVRGFLGLARCHMGAGEPDQAVDLLERGRREIGAREPRLTLLLGEALIDAQDLGRAGEILQEAEPLIGNVPAADEARVDSSYDEALARRAALHYGRGKLALAQLDYQAALEALKEAQRSLALLPLDSPALGSPLQPAPPHADLTRLLAECYAALGQPELAAAVYNELRSVAPKDPSPAIASAKAWIQAGRPDRALAALDEAAALAQSGEAWLEIARAQLDLLRPLADGQRRWQPFDAALARAKRDGAASADALLLEADRQLLAGQTAPALALLEQARALAPSRFDVLQPMLTLHVAEGRSDEAARLLDAFEQQNGRSDGAAAARVELTAAQGDLPTAIALLREVHDAAPRSKRLPHSLQLVRLQLLAGQVDGARRLLHETMDEAPQYKGLIDLAAELALQARDTTELAGLEQRLKSLEGDAGPGWRTLAVRRLLLENPTGPLPAEVDRLLGELAQQSPQPQAVHLLQGLAAERRGAAPAAIAAYGRAVRLGETRPVVYERLYELLARQGRALELMELVDRFGRALRRVTQQKFDGHVAADLGGLLLTTAVPAAADAARREPENPLRSVWLAQLLALDERREESRKLVVDAWKQSQGAPEVAAAILALAGIERDRPILDSVAKRLAADSRLPARRRDFLLAQARQLAGDDAAAEPLYRQLLETSAGDSVETAAAAQFFVGRDRPTAQATILTTLGGAVTPNDPRRVVARLLADHGTRSDWRTAWQAVFHDQGPTGDDESADLYAAVVACVKRGSLADYDRGIELLTPRTAAAADAQPDERFLLAGLYEARGRLKDARDQFTRLLSDHDDQAVYVAGYVEHLLRYNNLDEAADWLDTLRDLAPQDTEMYAMQARLLALRDRSDDIEPLVSRQVEALLTAAGDNDAARAHAHRFSAETYISIGNQAAAERELRLLQAAGRHTYEPLASWLIAQGRSGDAIDLCLSAAKQSPEPRDIVTLARLLCDIRIAAPDYQRAAELLDRTEQIAAQDAAALGGAAAAARYHGHNARAVTLLRLATAQQPGDAALLCDLAVTLSLDDANGAEAQRLANQARDLTGATPAVLDAQGQVLLNLRQKSEAAAVLEEAVELPGAGPLVFFHLATAEYRQGDLTAARHALNRARAMGLIRNGLMPTDRQSLVDLEQALGTN